MLIKDVGRGVRGAGQRDDFRERVMRWLAPIDPLAIAKDPECGICMSYSAGSGTDFDSLI